MRGSAYAVPAAALPFVVAATGGRVRVATERLVRGTGLTDAGYDALAERIDSVLAGRPAASVPEIRALLGGAAPERREALQRTVALMAAQARLVRAERRGGWRSDSYGVRPVGRMVRPPAGAARAGRRTGRAGPLYLSAFGPATAADLAWWSGWPRREAAAALVGLGDELVSVRLTSQDGEPAAAVCLAAELPGCRSADPDASRGVRLLPVWDSYLMGYADRRRLLRDEDRPWVYDASGNATSVVLVDGTVAGVWEHEGGPGEVLTVRVAPLRPGGAAWWDGVERAASELSAAVGAVSLRVERAARPGPLAAGARNAFLAPIRLGGAP